jgi:hypothetical protein
MIEPIIFLVVASYFIVFSLGYILAKMNSPKASANTQPIYISSPNQTIETRTTSEVLSKPPPRKIERIEIDDRKFITEMTTDNLEKKYDDLGKTTVAKDEGLSANVSKLASLKKSG